jgi:ribosomal protein L35AE/L33A
MTAGRGDGAARAVSALLRDRAHLLLPLAAQLGQTPPDFESTIRGSSMAPAIPVGARLRVRLESQRPCQVGDVVFYMADGGYTVHRVVHRAHGASGMDYLLTEGDARFAPDPPVPLRQVLGTVVAVEVDGRWQPVGVRAARPWHQRIARATTLRAMIAALWFGVEAASRLAAILLALESGVRVARRGLHRLWRGKGVRTFARRALARARFETALALSPLEYRVDRIRHPDVTYRKLDAARINALFPKGRRLEVIRAIRDSLEAADNQDYFRNMSWYNYRHRHLPRRIPTLDDLYPPNVAVLDFLAHSIAHPEQEVLLDFPCGIGVLLVYARDLGLTQLHGFDNWNYLAPSTAERFLRHFGMKGSVLVARSDLPSLPVTILTCVGFPLTMLVESSLVWAKPSVRYVLADRMGRPSSLPGFRRTTEYAGLLTVFERVS